MIAAADPRIDLACALSAAWSSGSPAAPASCLSDEAVLYDIVGGEHSGGLAIRDFFAQGLTAWRDLVLGPEQYWTSDDDVAVGWVMSARVGEVVPARFVTGNVGRRWRSEGRTWLRIADGRVTRDVHCHDSDTSVRSLPTVADGPLS